MRLRLETECECLCLVSHTFNLADLCYLVVPAQRQPGTLQPNAAGVERHLHTVLYS